MTAAPEDQASPPRRLTPEDERRRRARSVVIAWTLGGLAILFFVMTLVRLGGNIAERTL